MPRTRTLALPAALLAFAAAAHADPKNPTYDDDVVPVLRQHCFNCHNNDKQKGGLNLATYAALKEGGSSGDVVKAGDPDKSRLYTLTAHSEEPKMPPNAARIDAAKVDLLKLWVEQGARENKGSKVAAAAKPKVDIALKAVGKGRPAGPPPMPEAGKLPLDPFGRTSRPNSVTALAASPWAPLAAVASHKQILLYNTDTLALAGVLPWEHGQVNSLKFSRSGQFLLAAGGRAGMSGRAVLFSVATGAKVTEVGSAESDAILAADISADQQFIAVGTSTKMVRIYAVADGSVVHAIKKHTDWVCAVEFAPDGVLLATGDRNGGVFVWEAGTGREFYSLRNHTAMISDVSWRPDSNVLATASEDGTVRLWEMENGTQIKNWQAGGPLSVRYGADGRIATTGRDQVTKLYDGNGAKQKDFPALRDQGLRVAVAHDNARVIVGDRAGEVRVFTTAGALVGTLPVNPHPLAVRVKLAEEAVGAARAKRAAADAAVAAAKQAAAKAAADLAAGQKAVADTAAAAKAARDAAEALKAEQEKAKAARDGAQAKLAEVTAAEAKAKAALAEAEKRAKADEEKGLKDAKDDAGRDAARKRAADSLTAPKSAADKALADLGAARAAAQKAGEALAEVNKKLPAAFAAVKPASDAAREAPKRLPELQKAAKAAADAASAPEKGAADAAEEVKQTEAALAALTGK